jgi:hypothetical protein
LHLKWCNQSIYPFSLKKLAGCANLLSSFETDWFSAAQANVRTPIWIYGNSLAVQGKNQNGTGNSKVV